jgi:alanine-synthesizing transaminase
MFSSRIPADLGLNPVAVAVERMRCAGEWFDDLTGSNPTTAGFAYDPELMRALAEPDGLRYEPQPFGLLQARESVAADYARRGLHVAASHLVLTASSSESYTLLFKLLCDAGDSVLVPTPSYPLFEHLSRLDLVHARPYVTEFHGTWQIDIASVQETLDERTRAILVVSPSNPTGSWLKRDELRALVEICTDRQIALIADEVFCDFPVNPAPGAVAGALEQHEALVFSLGGLSKSVGLPQLKLGWIAVGGPAAQTHAALQRLEIIADTYLSVATPVQLAARRLLTEGGAIRLQIQRRIIENYRLLCQTAERCPACRALPVEGGWSAVVQTPLTMPADDQVVRLLEEARVLVHPGYLFDFSRDGYLVISLLTRPDVFAPAIERLFAGLDDEAVRPS